MGVLSDADIRRYIEEGKLVIDPLFPDTIRENGADLRLGNEVCELVPLDTPLRVSEKQDIQKYYVCYKGDEFTIKPRRRYLLTTLEYIKLPPDIMAFVNLRSTLARLGMFIPPTIVDAGFEGELTIELVGSEFPVVLKKGVRFLHLIFARLESPSNKPYNGKYHGQRGVKLPVLPI